MYRRVENLVPSLGKQVPFASLRDAIHTVQESSFKLDSEKKEAEEDFRKLLKYIPFPGRRSARPSRRHIGPFRRAADAVKRIFGVLPPTEAELRLLSLRSANSWEEYLEYVSELDSDEQNVLDVMTDKALEDLPLPFPIRRFIEAAKRVGKANRKLVSFERGFISEEGIKEREWYKHLGVAPGKWLGNPSYACFNVSDLMMIQQATEPRHSLA